jgi:hypothetical protein
MNLARAISSLCPDSQFVVEDDDYDKIRWIVQPDRIPTLEELQAESARLLQEDQMNEYKAKRRVEYPSIGDQLDALFHAGVFPPEMAAKIQEIKNKYPKQ